MNEQAIQQVIADYALENANLRVAVATLKKELEAAQAKEKKEGASK